MSHYFEHVPCRVNAAVAEIFNEPNLLKDAPCSSCTTIPCRECRKNEDPAVVRAAVRIDGRQIELADEELRGDRRLALAAVRQNGYALQVRPPIFHTRIPFSHRPSPDSRQPMPQAAS
jgi:hypothetical protein